MDTARLARVGLVALTLLTATFPARSQAAPPVIVLVADHDDDDLDGLPDRLGSAVSSDALRDAVSLDPLAKGGRVEVRSGATHARLLDSKNTVKSADFTLFLPALQGMSPGTGELSLRRPGGQVTTVKFETWALGFRDQAGDRIDPARDHLALSRLPPVRDAASDPESFRIEVTPPEEGRASPEVTVESLGASGVHLDAISPLAMVPCEGAVCFVSPPLRLVIDEADREHRLAAGHALRAEVGGAIVVRALQRKQMIRVLGPRKGPLARAGRLKLAVRPFVLRISQGGAPAIGGTGAGATSLVQGDLALASALFGQCGFTLGDTSKISVPVVDPPTSHLLSLGDRAGLPASGGELRMLADTKRIAVTVAKGSAIAHAAQLVSRALAAAGFRVAISPNARATSAAAASVDLLVRRADGSLATLSPLPGAPLSSDATLVAHIGSVDFSSGLEHFADDDSPTGTLQERTLAKAFDDHDPGTIELLIVPYLAGAGRIGESFITGESPSMRNVVIIDRAGVRARRTSFTAAHEIGHVLLAMPGHPDDFGIDTPTQLLDSDAADGSSFGPRRLTLEQCERALRESGPASASPLLTPWPLAHLPVRAEVTAK